MLRRVLVLLFAPWLVAGCGRELAPNPNLAGFGPVTAQAGTVGVAYKATASSASPPTAATSDTPGPPNVLSGVSLNRSFPSAPRAVAVDPATGDLYVVGEGGYGLPGWLAVVRDGTIVGWVSIGMEPRALAVHPRTGYAYVVNQGSDNVTMVRGTEVLAAVEVGHRPTAVAIHPDTGAIYVSNTWRETDGYGQPGTVSILSGTQVIAQVPVGIAPQQVEVHPGNGLVYIRNHRDSITVLRGTEVLADIALGLPWSLADLAIEPLTGYVYMACGNSLAVVDGTELFTTLDLGGSPIDALASDATTGYLYVGQQDTITVIDGLSVVATLPVKGIPNNLDCQPGTGYCYVTGLLDMGNTALTVLQGTQVLTTMWAGSYPSALVADMHGERMFLASDGLVVLAGPRVVETIGMPLGLSAAAAVATTEYLYLVARSPWWPGDRLLVVDGQEPIASVPIDGFSNALAVVPATGWLYLADRSNARVLVIAGTVVITTVDVGEAPISVFADPSTGLVYVVNASGLEPGLGAVDVLSGTEWLARVPVGDYPGDMVADPATGYVYVANRGAPPEYLGSLDVLSGTQSLATLPAGRHPHALVVNPATGTVYVPNRESEDVSVYRGLAQASTLALSGRPLDACLDAVTGHVYVAQEGGRVAVIGGTRVLAELPVAPQPREVACDPRSGYVYVLGERTLSGASHVTVLRRMELVTTMALEGSALSAMVVEPVTGLVYLFDEQNDELIVIGSGTSR